MSCQSYNLKTRHELTYSLEHKRNCFSKHVLTLYLIGCIENYKVIYFTVLNKTVICETGNDGRFEQ